VDGYAVSSADIPASGTATLEVIADLPAGSVLDVAVKAGQAVRIMTGAPMPAGADTVLPQELVERAGGAIKIPTIAKGANVRLGGEDVRAGTVVIPSGSVLRPQELGLTASLGLLQVLVRQKVRVAILSTGNEVAEPGEPRNPGQIYDSNRFSLRGLVEEAGGAAADFGIVPDIRLELKARLLEAARAAEIVLTSGGVSVGTYDLVKDVLGEIGGLDFWQVAMQPGRPLAVGRIGGSLFFGLPGNPVASMLTFLLFVRPALWKLAGRREIFPLQFTAVAVEPVRKKAGRREFKRGILTFMVAANCLIILEEPRGDVKPGETVLVEPFGALHA
jgi:molybdopterin molybdotransferase